MTSTSIDDDSETAVRLARSDSLRTAKGLAWAGLSVAILSGWFVVTRLGLRHDLNVWDVIALRFGEGATLLAPMLLVGPSRLEIRAWPQGILLAMLWGAPFVLLVVVGLQMTSAMLTSSITPTLMPVFAGLIAWALLGERPRPRQFCGYVLIAAGLSVLVFGYVLSHGGIDIVGAVALVTASAMWALYTLRLRRSVLKPLQAAALICFWSAVVYLPIYFGLGLSTLGHATGVELLFQSGYQGVLMSVVAIFAYNRAIISLGPRVAAAIIALVPVAAATLAIPFLGEWPSLPSAIAICAVALGVLVAAMEVGPRLPTGRR